MTIALIAGVIAAIILVGAVLIYFVMRNANGTQDSSMHGLGAELTNIKVGFDEASSDGENKPLDVTVASEDDSKKTDGLTRRFIAFGLFAAAVFASLAGRIWTLQVKSGQGYLKEAEENLQTTVSTPAPRGCIYDTYGRVLVENRASQTVLADPAVLQDSDVVLRLSTVLGIPVPIVRQRLQDTSTGAQSQRVIAEDVRMRDIAFISEHPDAYPGVSVETRTVREYPYGALAAHVMGYTGTPTKDELEHAAYGRNIQGTDIVGKSGVERSYDSVLAGDQGMRRMMVDAKGNVVAVIAETPPTKGSDLHLTIDAYAQSVADQLLKDQIAPLGDIGTGKGVAGAIVAMNVQDGSIPVMASYPTFDPTYFTNGIPQDIWDLYNTEESNAPMVNRVVNGQYGPASTFKAFSTLAGLHHKFCDLETLWECEGKWDGFGSGDVQKCWLHSGHGTMNLHSGIVDSCDVVFYEIGKAFFDHGPDGTGELSATALQEYIQRYRFGNPTGIDLPDESVGRIPTPEWKAQQWRNVPSEAYWRGGDYSNMIIGQGDVLITPLQLVVAYGAIATGKLLKPHLLKEVHNGEGEVAYQANTTVVVEPDVNQEHLDFVRTALHDMVQLHGTVGPAFQWAGIDAAGKSGTSEHTDREDDAWFVAYAPFDNPKYVVAVVLEEGGGGGKDAGPLAVKVMRALFEGEAENRADLEIPKIAGSSGKAVEVEFVKAEERAD